MQLQYNQVSGVTGITPAAQYNGNIASQSWGTAAAPNNKSYLYSYDRLNRLAAGTATDNNNETGMVYDQAGNLTALNRYQAGTLIDQLSYSYTNGGNYTNQVQSIADGSGSNAGLVSGTMAYSYDANGNLLTNSNSANNTQNKSFAYNLLNLPQTVTLPAGTVTYTYDAAGQKLRKVAVINGTTTATDYISGIQYSNSAIAFIQTDEGKAVPVSSGFDYTYYLGDNLGNTRITFDTQTGTAALQQQDDYYPFGMEINRLTTSPKNEYLYNKKELQEELGQLDYGARLYDPVIGRWNVIDPKAELGRRWSPYSYGFDDPIRFEDPDGMWPDGGIGDFFSGVKEGFVSSVKSAYHAVRHPIDTYNSMSKMDVARATIIAGPNIVYTNIQKEITGVKALIKGDTKTLGKLVGSTGATAAAVLATNGAGKVITGLRTPAASGLGDLTTSEVKSIQNTVNQAERPIEVGGSAASGTRRGVGTDLPIGKGPGTRSDIDYFAPPSSAPYFQGLEGQLPSLDPKSGIIPGTGNPFIGPFIRFEPNAKPVAVPKSN